MMIGLVTEEEGEKGEGGGKSHGKVGTLWVRHSDNEKRVKERC